MVNDGKAVYAGRKELPEDKIYKIYTMTFHGHYLEPIRKQFVEKGRQGLRRRLIIIDFDEERKKRHENLRSIFTGTENGEERKQSVSWPADGDAQEPTPAAQNEYVPKDDNTGNLSLFLEVLNRELHHNSRMTSALQMERQFNLVDYWFDSLRQAQPGRNRSSLVGRRSIDKDNKKPRLQAIKENGGILPQIQCTRLKPQRHNKVGRPKIFADQKFIEDEPERSKIFIVFVGKFDNALFVNLMRNGEPLRAVFNFYPDKSNFELLVPNLNREAFVELEMEKLEKKLLDFRAHTITKPTGVFRYFIPLISICQAERLASLIYDQLSWACYDVESLYSNYKKYYEAPFQEINVEIPKSVELNETKDFIKSLNVQGNYLMNPLPAIAADDATILLYMDMLFTTIEQSQGTLSEWEMVLLSTPLPKRLYLLYKDSVNALAAQYADAFYSITKLKKSERLFLEANNKTLIKMVQYVDHKLFRQIYLTCLEYKILRKYFLNDYCRNYQSIEEKVAYSSLLPPFARLYTTDDGVAQRLLELMDEYDLIDKRQLDDNNIIFVFQRAFNEVIECNRRYVLPTLLCFRDFTIYQLEEFLLSLVTPEIIERRRKTKLTDVERFELLIKRQADSYNPDMFIRPKSLKALRREAIPTLLNFKPMRRSTLRKDSAYDKDIQMGTDNFTDLNSSSALGLPADHPLLTGYNLENIRQEIWVKTSKYFFEEGNLQLHEQRWCFSDINKTLNLNVNNKYLTLNTPANNIMKVEPRLRLTTKNDITVRIHENPSECAKIVLNYPNGLSIYYEDDHAEQVWTRQNTALNEKHRIMTSFAAVIIEHIGSDLITILRYNGEIYRLYQYEFTFNEEEVEESTSVSEKSYERGTVTSSHIQMLVNDFNADVDGNFYASDRHHVPKEARLNKRIHQLGKTKKGNKQEQDAQSISFDISHSVDQLSQSEMEKDNIVYELDFLNKLIKIYGLSYKHLIVITSEGRVFNLMVNGLCYETEKVPSEEWHDYFANESYAMREDGLKMIWGKDYLKCFHNDGTVITTNVDDMYHRFEALDEDYGNDFSQSSSHVSRKDSAGDFLKREFFQSLQTPRYTGRSSYRRRKHRSYEPYLKTVGEIEEDETYDPGYILTNVTVQSIQHKNYASVSFIPNLVTCDAVDYTMKIKGIDDIVVQRIREPYMNQGSDRDSNYEISNDEEKSNIDTDVSAGGDASAEMLNKINVHDPDTHSTHIEQLTQASFVSDKTRAHMTSPTPSQASKRSPGLVADHSVLEILSEEKYTEDIFHDVTKIWIGNDFSMLLAEDYFEISFLLQRHIPSRGANSEKVEFRGYYEDNLQDIFHKIVSQISAFKKYHETKTEQMFFLETIGKNCDAKGLEFLEEAGKLGEYHNEVGNTITKFSPLKSIMDAFQNNFEWYEKDMAKFPRFQNRSRRTVLPIDRFPMVLDVNIILKVPRNLRFICDIHKFAYPLDGVNFKKTRYQIKETMGCYVRPHIAKEVQRLYSRNNWRRHQEETQRRKQIESQRIGLYQAILRHKAYPNYFLFTQKYNGKAKFIDYFDFCIQQVKKYGC